MEYQRYVLAQEVGAFAGLRGVEVEKRLELLGDLLLDLVVLGPILQHTNAGIRTEDEDEEVQRLSRRYSPRSKIATMWEKGNYTWFLRSWYSAGMI